MNLHDLKRRLSKDPSFRRQYARLDKEEVKLALHVRAVREDREMSQSELAGEAGVAVSALSQFENFDHVAPIVISRIVDHLEVRLRERGVAVDTWLIEPGDESPPTPAAPGSPIDRSELQRRSASQADPRHRKSPPRKILGQEQ